MAQALQSRVRLAKLPVFPDLQPVWSDNRQMQPLTVVTGILLGSSLSIMLSLVAVMVIYLILGDEYPRVSHEFSALVQSALIFLGLTTISGLSFYALLKRLASRWWLQAALWAALAMTTFYYWP
jgi:energy-converting hydrogenase Eha subunit A